MASPKPEASTIAGMRAVASCRVSPISMPCTTMLRRPDSSGSNPAESESSAVDMPSASQPPAFGRSTPAITRSSVDLPAPLAPISPSFSPGSTRRVMSDSAETPAPPMRARSR